jgi:hypothetical protein
MTEEEIKADLRRFFEILNRKEESDSGVVFSPITIHSHSYRVLLTEEVEAIFKRLKDYIK